MATDFTVLFTVAKVLSAVALLLVALAIVNVWRRDSLPGVTYGSVSLSPRRLRWVWTGVLIGATLLGSAEDPFVQSASHTEDPELSQDGPGLGTSLSVPSPFYRYERERRYQGDRIAEESETEGILIPWQLLSALFAYLILVVRWDPTSRWAIRLLRGRKAAREARKGAREARNAAGEAVDGPPR